MLKKILLVDDNEDLLLITNIILKGQGYLPLLATTVQEAEAAIRTHAPELILMDVNLKGEDGCTICRQLKAAPETAEIKIILMSGDEDNGRMAASIADDFLSKPFDFADLIARVEKQLVPVQQAAS